MREVYVVCYAGTLSLHRTTTRVSLLTVLDSGLKVQEIAAGDSEAPEVDGSSFVQCQYVLRRANGYFVDASYGFDRFDTYDFKMGKGKVRMYKRF